MSPAGAGCRRTGWFGDSATAGRGCAGLRDPLQVFGVGGVRAAGGAFSRYRVILQERLDLIVAPRQMVGHVAARHRDLVARRSAGAERVELLVQRENPVRWCG